MSNELITGAEAVRFVFGKSAQGNWYFNKLADLKVYPARSVKTTKQTRRYYRRKDVLLAAKAWGQYQKAGATLDAMVEATITEEPTPPQETAPVAEPNVSSTDLAALMREQLVVLAAIHATLNEIKALWR